MNFGQSVQGAIGGSTNHNYSREREMEKAAGAQIGPVPNRASEAMFHEIGQRFAYLGELIARLEALADRATGSVPQDPKVQAGMHSPNNLNEKISCTVQVVDEANARISAALQRLESFV